MANSGSLGTLSIDVVANIATMVSDLGRAQNETAKAARAMQRSMQDAADGIKDSLKSAFEIVGVSATVAGLREIVAQSLETAEQVDRMSQQIGASTDTIQTLSYAAALTGGSLESMSGALQKLERASEQAASGNKQVTEAFNAIGISAEQVKELLKDPDQLIQVVTKHLSEFADGSGKTAVAMQLMGRGAAENIPLLNKLGESYGDLEQQAKDANIVIGQEQTKALADAEDGLNAIGQQVKGLGNTFTIDLLPTITKVTQALQDWLSSDAVKSGIKLLADNIGELVNAAMKLPGELSEIDRQFRVWQGSVDDSNVSLASLLQKLQSFTNYQAGGPLTITFNEPDWMKRFVAATADIAPGVAETDALMKQHAANAAQPNIPTGAYDALSTTLKGIVDDFSQAITGADDFGTHVASSGKAIEGANKPLINYNANVAAAGKEAQKVANDLLSMQQTLDKIAGKTGGEYYKAWVAYQGGLDEVDKAAKKYIADGVPLQKVQEFVSKATQELNENLAAEEQAMRNANDAGAILSLSYAKAKSDLSEQNRLLGLNKEAAEADALANKLINDALGDMKNFIGPLTAEQQTEIDRLKALAQAATAQKTAIELSNQATKEWVSIWQQAGSQLADTFASILVNGGSLFDSLKNLAKQTVQQIIAYFAKLAVINPILNAIFGGSSGFSLLPTLAGMAGQSATGEIFGAGVGMDSSGNIFNSGSLMGAGQTMWTGFQKGLDGVYGGSGMGSSFLGDVTYGDFGNTFAPSALTYGASIAGGVYAGYNEFQNAGGGAAGIAGGAAYGVGTAYAGIGTAAVLSGGLSAGLAAIPVVGWIALAAMVLDMVSGGKLFGTKGKMEEGSTSLNIGAGGASFSNSISLKGQKALFGGAKWSTQDIAQTPEQAAAAQAYFDSMTKTMKQYADKFGVKAGDLVSASFQQVFDKHGKLTGETHANIAGYNYDNLTQDQFSQAYVAANELTVLDQFDSKLEDTIATFRKSADTLVQIANGLTEAEGYLQSGGDFLAIVGKDTLSAIVTLATGMQQSGETIDQTINRLIQAQQQYDQFVGQFKPAATYVDAFEASLSSINTQMLANIKQANALAQAAGAAGASEQDLANIHRYAAQQMAQALAQLESAAQSNAFGLGLSNTGSLDEVNSEIQRLQAKANAGKGAISGFGNAMQSAAQKASDAINLLIGDLSPLNDQQKLQKALEGLRAGTVTQDQVLQIGRRLYASSQAYTDLFNMVQGLGGRGGANQVAASGSRGGGGLSGAENARLQQLLKEQQQLQAAAQLQQYQTLAQQIAEISSAKGEDWKQVVSDMGIDLGKFEKGLGMNDAQLDTYIKNFQALKDSNGDNTTSIVAVLNQILIALGGTPTAAPPTTDPNAPPTGGRSGHGSHGVRDAIVEGFRQVTLQGPRNLRPTRVTVPA